MTEALPTCLCSAENIQARNAHFAGLSAVYAGKASLTPYFVNGVIGTASTNRYKDPKRWVEECLVKLAEKADVIKDPTTLRLLVIQCDLYGVHFIDKIFGARVYATETGWWADKLPTSVGRLEFPDLDNNETWGLAKTMAEAFVDSKVTVPVFALPTIASVLNIAVNLYNEEFLIALLDDPDAARHDLTVINKLLCALHRWFMANIPPEQLQLVVAVRRAQPPGFGQVGGCTTHLLSAEQYKEFIAPLDQELLSTYPHGGMIHLCGAHTQHIPVWREMSALRAVQLNDRAAEDFQVYYNKLREDQIIYIHPTPTMDLDRIMQISSGKRVVIMGQAPTQ
jgi:hypothetical protein